MSCKVCTLNTLNKSACEPNLNGDSSSDNQIENNLNQINQANDQTSDFDNLNEKKNDIKLSRILSKKVLPTKKHVLVTGGAG